jgi:dCTP diphosphatase
MTGEAEERDALEELRIRLRSFARARDWEQFHTPKNLAMALAGEVGELLEIFQWLTPEQAVAVMDGERADDVRDELADVLIYLVRLADVLDVDLAEAATSKIERNETRYPEHHVIGRADHRPFRA